MKKTIFILLAIFLTTSLSAEFLQEAEPSYANKMKEEAEKLPNFKSLVPYFRESIVNISVESKSEKIDPKAINPFFSNKNGSSLGSGFVISTDGYIATNYHVVENAEKIKIRFDQGKEDYIAKLIGFDVKTDIALLKIDSKDKLVPMYMGNSDKIDVGEWVLAIGNQFQLGQTVTAGIVSAKARKVNILKSGPYDNFIQTDASINPGSSGGPLVNTQGQVVGINTAIMSPGRNGGQGFNIGIGFALPVNLAKKILTELKEHGNITRGLLGVLIQEIDSDMASALGLKDSNGALVSEVMPNTPAELSNFKIGDVILTFDGSKVEDFSDLPLLVAETPVNKKVEVEVLRSSRVISLYPKITKLTDSKIKIEEDLEIEVPDILGLIVQDLTHQIVKAYHLKSSQGVIINAVEPQSIAAQYKLRVGDVLLEVNGKPVKDRENYISLLKRLPKEDAFLVLIARKSGSRFYALKLTGKE